MAGRRKHSGIAGGSSQASAFTLVEMLVVISIILVVAVVALPAVNSLSKSASRRSAASQVMAALDQARTQAIAQAANCYFVFADDDAKLPESYRYRAYAVFQETYEPGSQLYLKTMVRPWALLPEGVAFRPRVTPTADGKVLGGLTIFNAPKAEPKEEFYCKPAGKDLRLPFIKFNSFGAVAYPVGAAYARVKLFEGFIAADGSDVSTNAARRIADETITVALFTGRAKREELNATN